MADLAPDTAAAPPASPEPSSAPAAPATPSPAAAPSSAPKSIADETAAVFRAKRDALAPAGSSPAEPDSASPAQAARVPGVAGEAQPPVRGPIPYQDHERILRNTREKARAEAETELRSKLGWADGLDAKRANAGMGLLAMLEQDPEGTIALLQRQHQRSQPAAPAEDPEPQADVELLDGQKFYSATQQQKWAEWRERKLEAKLTGQFAPILQTIALERLQAQTTTEATQQLKYYHANFPKFKELEKDIKDLCLRNPNLSIEHAYALVFRDKGLAAEKASWESERAGQLARKAAASSAPPGAPQPGTPRPNSAKSTLEIAREVFARKRAAAG